MKCVDLEWVVSAIDINRETGGNLSETLTTVSETIRERMRMQRQVRSLTAEGAHVGLHPDGAAFVIALYEWRAKPDDFGALFHGGWAVALAVASMLMVVGWFWIKRIIGSTTL